MRSWVRELAHQRRDRSRDDRIHERLSMRKLRRDSKPIVEHAASTRRVIDALVRRLPRNETGASGKLGSTLCSYPRNVTVNRCRAGGRGALGVATFCISHGVKRRLSPSRVTMARRSWHGRQRRQKRQGKKQATTTEQTEGRGTKKAGQKPAANSSWLNE